MDVADLLYDAFERIRGAATRAVDGLDVEALTWRPDAHANSIAWLVWHLARIQDDHVAEVADREQIWVRGAWAGRFGLAADSLETGFGHSSTEVAAIRPDSADALVAYLDAVTDQTQQFLDTVDGAALDRIVDRSWDPPVTLGVRLVSVIADGLQHADQAAYVRGLQQRAR